MGEVHQEVHQEIKKALKALGYRESDIEIEAISYRRLSVSTGDDHIGIYDLDRHTFVD